YVISSHDFGYAKESSEFWSSLQAHLDLVREKALFVDDNETVLTAAKEFGIKHLFNVAQPSSAGESKTSNDYYCLESFEEFSL
ncbi:MAG: haloacid dehalogenase, partial [Gammaproteobacteria bacterium]